MTFYRSMIIVLMACFLCVWSVDTPTADAKTSKRKIKKYAKCIEKGNDTCSRAYDDCPDKIRDVELKKLSRGKITAAEFLDRMGNNDEKCFKNLVKCNEGYEKLCGRILGK